jgi:hypothetical protein
MKQSDQDPQALRTSLRASLDQAEWSWIARHLERDAVIVVTLKLDLVEVAAKVAEDDTAAIQGWISQGHVRKPTREELEAWGQAPDRKFATLVVQPYVLIQETPLN